MASSLEVTRVVSPCGAVPNERKRRTAGERRKKRVVVFFRLDKRVGDDEKNYNRNCTTDFANFES